MPGIGRLVVPVALAGFAASAEPTAPQFQAILDSAVASGLPAVSAHVSWNNGLWSGVAGKTSADSGEPLNSDSRFRLASITKLFTSVVVLQLVDEKVLQLSDVLLDRLPGSPVADIPHADSITIAMLLDHTSGIHSFTDVDGFWREAYSNAGLDRIWQPAELIGYSLQKRPYFEPGFPGRKQYSNSNYILLGMIIEAVTDESLASAYRNRIYERSGMTHTLLEGFDSGMDGVQHSFLKTSFRNRLLAMKRDWNKSGPGGLYDVSGNYRLYNSWAWAAGGISSSASDLHRFLSALRNGALLSEESHEVLFRNNSATGSAGVVFGGSGGWEGITAAAYEINNEVQIVVLVNATGFAADLDANALRAKLYRVLQPQN
ncbi:MAG: serine hydrolase [Gammaproteobacteria bacterium]|nr:serine hydrolase [Gammaproteobacteria bacterium]